MRSTASSPVVVERPAASDARVQHRDSHRPPRRGHHRVEALDFVIGAQVGLNDLHPCAHLTKPLSRGVQTVMVLGIHDEVEAALRELPRELEADTARLAGGHGQRLNEPFPIWRW